MNRVLLFILFLTLAIMFAGCQSIEWAGEEAGPGYLEMEAGGPHNYRYFAVSKDGYYDVELAFRKGIPVAGLNDLDMILHDKYGRQISGAEISVIPVAPNRLSSSIIPPMIIEQGEGIYNIRRLELSIPGVWNLWIRISTPASSDRAFIVLKVDQTGEMEGAMSQVPDLLRASLLDRSDVVSARGIFNVYKDPTFPVPLGKLHSWEIRVTDKLRIPVSDAKITVTGGMPANGYSLPTRPVVIEPSSPGIYRIDRMKFTEPGMWVVRLYIDTGFEKDTAEFLVVVH